MAGPGRQPWRGCGAAPHLVEDNLTVVGDDYQAIYKFRGSTVRNILDFTEMYRNSKSIILTVNYRSPPCIVNASSRLISRNVDQVHKAITSHSVDYDDATFLVKTLDSSEEARELVRLLTLHHKEIVVLTRTNIREGDPIPSALRVSGIEYRIVGRSSFFEKKEVSSALSIVSMMSTGRNSLASFSRSLHIMGKGVGPATLDKIREEPGDFLESARRLSAKSKKIRALVSSYDELSKEFSEKDLVGFVIHLADLTRCEHEKANLLLLADMSLQYSSAEDFVDQCRLYFDFENEKGVQEEENTRVTIMTVHKAKGLEFDVVFVAGCTAENFPFACWGSGVNDMEEERRLFFVAMTRAKSKLYLSVPGRMSSPFISEFPAKNYRRI